MRRVVSDSVSFEGSARSLRGSTRGAHVPRKRKQSSFENALELRKQHLDLFREPTRSAALHDLAIWPTIREGRGVVCAQTWSPQDGSPKIGSCYLVGPFAREPKPGKRERYLGTLHLG